MSKKKIYKYEMHLHTSPCSGGGSDICDHIDELIRKGYSGAVVTNHFFNGDTRIDRSLPWEEFVAPYKEDYLRGLAYAKSLDFDLLFGLEEQVGGGQEILLYGITPDFIAAHPELKNCKVTEYVDTIHSCGGLVYQAHPYRSKAYITRPFPLECIKMLDGVESYNASNNDPEWNESAQRFAEEMNIACIGGSDGHSTQSAGRSGIAANERIKSNDDLVRILKSGDYTVIKNED